MPLPEQVGGHTCTCTHLVVASPEQAPSPLLEPGLYPRTMMPVKLGICLYELVLIHFSEKQYCNCCSTPFGKYLLQLESVPVQQRGRGSKNTALCTPCTQKYISHAPLRELLSGSLCLLEIPRYRKERRGGRSFWVPGARFWNSLSVDLWAETDLLISRRKLKQLCLGKHMRGDTMNSVGNDAGL